ncbi:MAG: hypothetical protein QOD41_1816 [Cryptosporangiaceae bacterium]|nr:hypothetical protein [Cryptosporangiaceae bacterium]
MLRDAAQQLTGWLASRHALLRFDRDAVRFGAATHDVGKTVHTGELSGPGFKHEQTGQRILAEAGIQPGLAPGGRHSRHRKPDSASGG